MHRAALTLTATLVAAFALSAQEGVLAGERPAPSSSIGLHMPWKKGGLTEREAAAHLLSRFTFGTRPGQVDEVMALGLERWFERQLAGTLPDTALAARLADLPALRLSASDILKIYPPPGAVLAEARKAGAIPAELVQGAKGAKATAPAAGSGTAAAAATTAPAVATGQDDRKELRQALLQYAEGRGYRPQRELLGQLMAQKLYRAAQSENQLTEVMTDFWYNHFNVSMTDNKTRPYLLSYERDAIRPHALGRVRELLESTSHHPAMLLYLDNAQSSAAATSPTTLEDEIERLPRPADGRARLGGQRGAGRQSAMAKAQGGKKGPHGLNENYARELLELHTLGVEGGYTQKDVIEVARAFTGWTILPAGPAREQAEKRLERVGRAGGMGFVHQGEFLFRADFHDSGAKLILGRSFPAGRGLEDGEQVLDLLATHAATARHLSSQLAARFVADTPPKALVDRLTALYLTSGGDVRQLLRGIVESPEFWSREAVGAKVKSPFELAVSAVRAAGARVDEPKALLDWITRMGQPLYAYQAPTGYPDRAEAWVNTGSLLNRMNFGLQLAAQRVPGVGLDLPALSGGHEPESREQALKTYAELLMPGRNLSAALKQLTPMVADPNLARRVDDAAPAGDPGPSPAMGKAADSMAKEAMDEELIFGAAKGGGGRRRAAREAEAAAKAAARHPPTSLEQVVGVILGSPEFQRR